jgi:hypothetical protein
MYQTELVYFIVLSIVILSAPFLPNSILFLLDHMVIRIGSLILLLYLVSIGPTAGIFGLIMVSILYLERNRRKVGVAMKRIDAMDVFRSPQATVQEASTPQQTVPVQPFDKPQQEEKGFLPPDEPCDITNFDPVAPSQNEKAVLSTIYPLQNNGEASASQNLYEEMGFGHVRGVDTIGQ